MSDKIFTKKDFEGLKKLRFHGKISEGVDAELYWINCMDGDDAVFSQTIRTHSHDFFEIHFVLSGRITYSFEDKAAALCAPSFLIIPDSVAHTVEAYSADMLKVSAAVSIGRDEPIYAALKENGLKAMPVDEKLISAVSYCTDTAQKNTVYREALIKNRVFELLLHVSGGAECSPIKRGSKDVSEGGDVRLFKAKQFIRDNPGVFVGCKELALYCNISPKQLNRIFVKYEGVPLLKYVHDEKLRQAREMLVTQNGTLEKISESLGFSSVYYFSKFFADKEGCSPAAFRKLNGR